MQISGIKAADKMDASILAVILLKSWTLFILLCYKLEKFCIYICISIYCVYVFIYHKHLFCIDWLMNLGAYVCTVVYIFVYYLVACFIFSIFSWQPFIMVTYPLWNIAIHSLIHSLNKKLLNNCSIESLIYVINGWLCLMENCVRFECDGFHLHRGLSWWFSKGVFLTPGCFFRRYISMFFRKDSNSVLWKPAWVSDFLTHVPGWLWSDRCEDNLFRHWSL